MFLYKCKLIIKKRVDYFSFINHFTDVLHGDVGSLVIDEDKFPLYFMIDLERNIIGTYDAEVYRKSVWNSVTIQEFFKMEYVVTHHFRRRFDDRYEEVSNTRFKKLIKNMFKNGTRLKRRDASKALKYHRSSEYVLISRYIGNDKKFFLIVMTYTNILTTIYEFDIKDLKYFKEI